MSLEPGTRLGRYEVREKIGAGGMGEVYLAHDAKLGRDVALKLLPDEFASDHRRMSRFVQEARAASALNHPNIITIYEIDDESRPPYIASELVEGETLRAAIARGPVRLADALDIAAQIASALAAAHAAGIVHRDIKPENVMLRRDGYVKVLDFGLAKLTSGPPSAIDTEAATRALVLTDPGAVMGTVAYMSPEQARGRETDARTDIWSLGVVLYEMIAGRLPFAGETPSHTVVSILEKEPPPLSSLAPHAPEALELVVAQALAKDADERYQTARQFLAALKQIRRRVEAEAEIERTAAPDLRTTGAAGADTAAAGESAFGSRVETVGVRADTVRSGAGSVSSAEYVARQIGGHKRAALAVAAVVLAGAGALGFGLYKFFARGAHAAHDFSAMKIERLTDTGKAGSVAISPDGKMVVHVKEDAGQQSLWVRHVATGSNVQIIAPAEVTYWRMTFTPDGGYVYFMRSATGDRFPSLYSVAVFGGEPKKINGNVGSSVTFSPDARQIAFVRFPWLSNESQLVIANADGTNERVLAAIRKEDSFKGNGPAWSPDGRVIAVAVYAYDGGYHEYPAAVSVADGSIKPVGNGRWDDVGRVGWLADGSALVVACEEPGARVDQYYLISYPDGAARRITNDLNDYHDLSLTADTNTLAAVQEDRALNIWVAPAADARSLRQLTSGSFKYEGADGVRWMPDGRIVYTAIATGSYDIWIINADGTGQRQLTKGPAGVFNGQPAVSPDGRYVVFLSDRTGRLHLWRVDIDGGNLKQLTDGDSRERNPSFSPDGRWVFYASRYSDRLELFKIATDGGEPVRLTEGFLADTPLLSPDGKTLASYYREGETALKISILPPGGGKPLRILDGPAAGSDLRWLPDSRALAYVDTQKGVSNVWALPVDGGKPRQLTDFTAGQISTFDLSRDGRPTLFSRGTTTRDVVLITGFK